MIPEFDSLLVALTPQIGKKKKNYARKNFRKSWRLVGEPRSPRLCCFLILIYPASSVSGPQKKPSASIPDPALEAGTSPNLNPSPTLLVKAVTPPKSLRAPKARDVTETPSTKGKTNKQRKPRYSFENRVSTKHSPDWRASKNSSPRCCVASAGCCYSRETGVVQSPLKFFRFLQLTVFVFVFLFAIFETAQ